MEFALRVGYGSSVRVQAFPHHSVSVEDILTVLNLNVLSSPLIENTILQISLYKMAF